MMGGRQGAAIGPRLRPPALDRVRALRPRRSGSRRAAPGLASASLTAVTRGVALKSGLAKGPWPAVLHLAAVTQLAGHPAAAGLHPVLGQQPGEAAWMTMASLFTLAASMSGVLYYFARTTWEGIEPFVFGRQARAQQPVMLHGVDVSDSRFFTRPVVQRAAEFAAEAHSGQIRKTRQPYVTHCVETALIVEGLLSPTEEDERAEAAVVAALLHDVLDDTDVDFAEVETLFGEQVATMVLKVSQLSTTNQIVRRRLRVESAQATHEEGELLRNMILTMVSEPLVIAIKLADRLHNMRTVYALSPEKQQAVASETRRVWCSLAERLGMFALKSELEDLCFAVLQPAEYRTLRRELDALWGVPTIPLQAIGSLDLVEECECLVDEAGVLHLTTKPRPQLEAAAAGSADRSADGGANGTAALTAAGAELEAAALLERQQSHAAASTSSSSDGSALTLVRPSPPKRSGRRKGSGKKGSSDVSSAAAKAAADNSSPGPTSGGMEWLTPQQQEARELIETVLPFDATTFNIAKLRSGAGGRRGLEVLQACAQLLMREIGTESLASGLEVSVQGRLKSLYSTFRKMARKRVPLSEVYDARALRVIVDDDGGRRQSEAIAACYKLLPAVHRLFRRVDGEEDDYIAQPKPSGYQSLHTAVTGPGGVPMEVQMRTSSMHSDAEYGKAAHWAYKEKPATAPSPASSTTAAPRMAPAPGPAVSLAAGGLSSSSEDEAEEGDEWHELGIVVGQPVLHIGAGGRLRDGVVVESNFGGRRLLCAVSQAERTEPGARPAPAESYRRLASYVEERGWFEANMGDLKVALELFTLCSDGKYHRIDRFGHKLATIVVPLTLEDHSGSTSLGGLGGTAGDALHVAAAPEQQLAAGGGAEGEMDYMNNRIRLLRSMLEWGRELGSSIAAESVGGPAALGSAGGGSGDGAADAAAQQARDAAAIAAWTEAQLSLPAPGAQGQGGDVMVVIWPGGKIMRVPRGTTAGSVIRTLGLIEIAPETAVRSDDGRPRSPSAAAASTAAAATVSPTSLTGDGVAMAARQLSRSPPPGLLVNVNNRLVPEETPLFDGDYVVLSRDRVRI